MSPASRIISTWHSGSPKRALNSTTLGPSAVAISPAYRTPRYGMPSRAMPAMTGWTMVRSAASTSSGVNTGAGE